MIPFSVLYMKVQHHEAKDVQTSVAEKEESKKEPRISRRGDDINLYRFQLDGERERDERFEHKSDEEGISHKVKGFGQIGVKALHGGTIRNVGIV